MRKKICILLFFFSTTFSFSQSDWFPVGAKWHYNVYSPNSTIFETINTYTIIDVIGDTTLQGKKAGQLKFRRIDSIYAGYGFHNYFGFDSIFYIYEENKKVFLFHSYSETFNLLYDFNANPGDSWKVKNMCDSATAPNQWKDSLVVNIDSVSYLNISGNNLKVLHYHLDNGSFGQMAERIGLLGTPFWEELATCRGFIAEGVPYPIRCYEDGIIGFHQFNSSIPCDTIIIQKVGIDDPQPLSIKIYPNPATDYITIDHSAIPPAISLKIYDISGRKIYEEAETGYSITKISTQNFRSGMYFLELISEEGKYMQKFIRN